MTQIPRKTIQELEALYSLEPTLRDVFVEGDFDREVLEQNFPKTGKSTNWAAYVINTVDVGSEILDQYGLTRGNKQRVIALAQKLRHLPDEIGVRLLVDRDLDHWFCNVKTIPRLIWTDYSCMEAYFFSEKRIRTIILTLANAKISHWSIFFKSLVSVLADLCAIRLADRELSTQLDLIPADRCLSFNGSALIFEVEKHMEKLLHKNGKHNIKKEFFYKYRKWRKELQCDPRQFIHGHDLIDLLGVVIRLRGRVVAYASSEVLGRFLISEATNEPEIQKMLERELG